MVRKWFKLQTIPLEGVTGTVPRLGLPEVAERRFPWKKMREQSSAFVLNLSIVYIHLQRDGLSRWEASAVCRKSPKT